MNARDPEWSAAELRSTRRSPVARGGRGVAARGDAGRRSVAGADLARRWTTPTCRSCTTPSSTSRRTSPGTATSGATWRSPAWRRTRGARSDCSPTCTLSGMFDRYPTLRIGFAECSGSWLGGWLNRMTYQADYLAARLPGDEAHADRVRPRRPDLLRRRARRGARRRQGRRRRRRRRRAHVLVRLPARRLPLPVVGRHRAVVARAARRGDVRQARQRERPPLPEDVTSPMAKQLVSFNATLLDESLAAGAPRHGASDARAGGADRRLRRVARRATTAHATGASSCSPRRRRRCRGRAIPPTGDPPRRRGRRSTRRSAPRSSNSSARRAGSATRSGAEPHG